MLFWIRVNWYFNTTLKNTIRSTCSAQTFQRLMVHWVWLVLMEPWVGDFWRQEKYEYYKFAKGTFSTWGVYFIMPGRSGRPRWVAGRWRENRRCCLARDVEAWEKTAVGSGGRQRRRILGGGRCWSWILNFFTQSGFLSGLNVKTRVSVFPLNLTFSNCHISHRRHHQQSLSSQPCSSLFEIVWGIIFFSSSFFWPEGSSCWHQSSHKAQVLGERHWSPASAGWKHMLDTFKRYLFSIKATAPI